jgi:hypothetical protein
MDLEKAEMPSDKAAMMEEFERRKRVRAITVSTNDSEVNKNKQPMALLSVLWIGSETFGKAHQAETYSHISCRMRIPNSPKSLIRIRKK